MGPDDYFWLGRWEAPVYFGKHDKYEPAFVCNGYLYSYDRNGNLYGVPWTSKGGRQETNWSRSPQVRHWLDEPKQRLAVRFGRFLHRLFTGR